MYENATPLDNNSTSLLKEIINDILKNFINDIEIINTAVISYYIIIDLNYNHCPGGCPAKSMHIVIDIENVELFDGTSIKCNVSLSDPESFNIINDYLNSWLNTVKSQNHIEKHAYLS